MYKDSQCSKGRAPQGEHPMAFTNKYMYNGMHMDRDKFPRMLNGILDKIGV